MNDFHEQLKWSAKQSHEVFWEAVYRKAFPGMSRSELCLNDMEMQRQGIDRLIYLTNGRVIRVDEKKRSKDYGDMLIEYVSNDWYNTPGWIEKDLAIDYLAYAIMPTKQCYLFDWQMLRRAWKQFGETWIAKAKAKQKGYLLCSARNENYNTLSVSVPMQDIRMRVLAASIIDVSDELTGVNLHG